MNHALHIQQQNVTLPRGTGKTMTGMTLMPIPKIPKDIECNNPTLTRCLFQPSFQHCVNSLDLNLAQDMQHLTMPGSPCLSTGRMGMIGAGGPMTRRMPTIIKTIQGDHLPCPIYFSSITYNLINIYLYIYMYIYIMHHISCMPNLQCHQIVNL